MILAFFGLIIIAFQVDLYDVLTGVKEFKITVENQTNKTKDVYFYLQNKKTDPDMDFVSDMSERYISKNKTRSIVFKYKDPDMIKRVRIYVYNLSEGRQKYIDSYYDFPEDTVYNLKVTIDKTGKNLTITKAS